MLAGTRLEVLPVSGVPPRLDDLEEAIEAGVEFERRMQPPGARGRCREDGGAGGANRRAQPLLNLPSFRFIEGATARALPLESGQLDARRSSEPVLRHLPLGGHPGLLEVLGELLFQVREPLA